MPYKIMERFPEYELCDAVALAELIRCKKVTPSELCEAAIERIEWLNPGINAVVTPLFGDARRNSQAYFPNSPLSGVPILLKDLDFAYAGAPMTSGCRALTDYIPDRDSEMVRRFKIAGTIILGKTNTSEFGLSAITEPELFGPCRNPWNLDHTPGGSSGGSAAAVAAGMVPLAAAGDYGGSLRIPAAYCGLFGMKPSRGRNPNGPSQGQIWLGAAQSHVITRSVRDSAAMLDATCGPDVGAPYIICPPQSSYLKEVGKSPGRLRIAFNSKSPIGTSVHPECIRTVEHTARTLEKLGHHVEEAAPDVDGPAMTRSYLALSFGEVAANVKNMEMVLKRKVRAADMEPLTWTMALMGQSHSAGYLVQALRQWDRTAHQMGDFFQTYDLYLTPTTAFPPAKVGEMNPRSLRRILIRMVDKIKLGRWMPAIGLLDQMAKEILKRTPFTQLANLCGLPAMSVPMYWTTGGLPCGAQFVGPFGREDRLFRLAGQLEDAQPWFYRRPELYN